MPICVPPYAALEGGDLKGRVVELVALCVNRVVGEPIDDRTREVVADSVYEEVGKLYPGDFRVECSGRNNPPDLVDRNGVAVRLTFFGRSCTERAILTGTMDVTFDSGLAAPRVEWRGGVAA